jgi:DNA/RNA-binding domain of Phe-tRNA-synthetase-like protein
MPKPNNSQLKISPEIRNSFPDYNPVIFYVAKFTNSNSEIPKNLLKDIQLELTNSLTLDQINKSEQILKWREAYKSFGANPKRTLNSCESLLTRILKGGEISSINPIVDLYNYISLKYLLPIGGENWDKLGSDLYLKYSTSKEGFDTRENGQEIIIFPKVDEVIWADSLGATCRCWNWRQCIRTQIDTKTQNMYFVIDYFGSDNSLAIRAKDELLEILQKISSEIEVF